VEKLGAEAVKESNKKGLLFFLFVGELARQEMQRQIKDDGENNHTGDANGLTLVASHTCCQGARRDGDNSNNHGCLHCWLIYLFRRYFLFPDWQGEI
jgi:hypothetical protein